MTKHEFDKYPAELSESLSGNTKLQKVLTGKAAVVMQQKQTPMKMTHQVGSQML